MPEQQTLFPTKKQLKKLTLEQVRAIVRAVAPDFANAMEKERSK